MQKCREELEGGDLFLGKEGFGVGLRKVISKDWVVSKGCTKFTKSNERKIKFARILGIGIHL